MRTILPCAISLAVTSIFVLNGCQSTEPQTPSKPSTVIVSTKNTTPNKSKTTPQSKQPKYEKAPDLSTAEILTAPPKQEQSVPAQEQKTNLVQEKKDTPAQEQGTNANQGQLIEDALSNGKGATSTEVEGKSSDSNTPDADSDADTAPYGHSSVLGSVNNAGTVQESTLKANEQKEPVIGVPVGKTNVSLGQAVANTTSSTPSDRATKQDSLAKFFPKRTASGCSTELHSEATGIARTLARELATRLRKESGSIYVAPTIVDREYKGCVGNLSTAIQDGLSTSDNFQVNAGNINLSNISAQNAGSATILPTIIHQCRASNIPYVVVSQIKKSGDKAALSLRIVKTADGITLGQTYRRLSQ